MKNFAEIFCEKHGIDESDFEPVIFKKTLHPAARLLRPLLNLNPDFFEADREFIRCVGRITRTDQFDSEALDFTSDSKGRGLLHRKFKLRVSRQLLGRLVRSTFKNQN